MQIAIMENDEEDYLLLQNCVDSFFKEKDIEYETKRIQNEEQLLQNSNQYDLIFLDIELDNANGVELGIKLKEENEEKRIIFTTRYNQYAILGYQANALRYFLKPIEQKQFNIEMESVLKDFLLRNEGIYDSTISDSKIYYKDIIYIEYQKKWTYIHLSNDKVLKTKYSLKQWVELLPSKLFAQCYKSLVINLDYISDTSCKEIQLMNAVKIPLSKHYKKSFDLLYTEYLIHRG